MQQYHQTARGGGVEQRNRKNAVKKKLLVNGRTFWEKIARTWKTCSATRGQTRDSGSEEEVGLCLRPAPSSG